MSPLDIFGVPRILQPRYMRNLSYFDRHAEATPETDRELVAEACSIRAAAWGAIVTYSRKVFIPLTNLCRDECGYCVFVKRPGTPGAGYMTPDEVLAVARAGEAMGCKEALFSLGERPELRYPEAKAALRRLGYERTVDYLRAMCALVLRETGLLPHVNAGTLLDDEFELLRPVSASMGMMMENISRRLTRPGGPHHACPDKVPLQRLRALERAGAHRVPFTTGLLIGIGETWRERLETLEAIESAHRRHGHVQEVIVQNFRAKPGIAMAHYPEPDHADMLRTLAVARCLLSPEISLQAPPNLQARHEAYLDAGLNDWGGISPVTIDHINPERAWPRIAELAATTARRGGLLKERLPLYPRFLREPERWLDEAIRPRVLAMAGADGLAELQCVA